MVATVTAGALSNQNNSGVWSWQSLFRDKRMRSDEEGAVEGRPPSCDYTPFRDEPNVYRKFDPKRQQRVICKDIAKMVK